MGLKITRNSHLSFLITFNIVYASYNVFILFPLLSNAFGEVVKGYLLVFFIIPPVVTYLIIKLMGNRKYRLDLHTNFVFTILTSAYLLITALISWLYITFILGGNNYVIITFLLLLVLLLVILLRKNLKLHIRVNKYLFLILVGVILLQLIDADLTIPLGANFNKVDNPLPILFLSLPILLEPLLMIGCRGELRGRLNTKKVIALMLFFSFLNLLTLYFDLSISFSPTKMTNINNIIHVVFMFIISYIRYSFSFLYIKDNFYLNNRSVAVLVIIFMGLCASLSLDFKNSNAIIGRLLLFTSFSLSLVLVLLIFLFKRKR